VWVCRERTTLPLREEGPLNQRKGERIRYMLSIGLIAEIQTKTPERKRTLRDSRFSNEGEVKAGP